MLRSLFFSLLVCQILVASEIRDLATQPLPNSTFSVARGTLELSRTGRWQVRGAELVATEIAPQRLRQVYLTPPKNADALAAGRRMTAILRQRRIDAGRTAVSYLHWPCAEYAREHNGQGPDHIGQLDHKKYRYAVSRMTKPPRDWLTTDGKQPAGPFVALLKAEFKFTSQNARRVATENREVLAVELRPYVNDGKHWVQYTDGTTRRDHIDEALLKKHQLQIRPVIVEADEIKRQPGRTLQYQLIVVYPTNGKSTIDVTLEDALGGGEESFAIHTAQAQLRSDVLPDLEAARRYAWEPYIRTGPSPILRAWGQSAMPASNQRPARGRNLSMFSLLGGRAAIEETLQLQNLVVRKKQSEQTVDVSSIPSVAVKAHPYEELLGETRGGSLELANCAPHDRFFVYVAQPSAVLPFIDAGGEFLASVGAGFSSNRLDYGLRDKYFDRLGLDRRFVDTAVRSGLIREMMITTPDLFFVDGTDLTVVARLDQPQLFSRLLTALNIRGLSDGLVAEHKTEHGAAYWTLRGDLLCISSNRGELDGVLHLMDNDGSGSLGRSAEFRYMLTKLPVVERTRAFAYFSDPFVRRLVGPSVKIGQLRRMNARRMIEHVTAKSLHARLDGARQATAISSVANYTPLDIPPEEFSIDPDGVVDSATYGRLERLRTLQEVPVEQATPAEIEAYRNYKENYEQDRRQFFDPIAIRLSDAPDGSLELETFILPLIDSSIYNSLRDMMHGHADHQPLQVPQLQPTPILQFSVNLNEKAWQQTIENFSDFFQRYSGANSAILDDLGPGAHLAVFDADPVIALGSGDLMGAMGGNLFGRLRGDRMIAIPVMLSVLTRPCTMLVETRNPEQTARYLRQSALGHTARTGDFGARASFYQQGDGDSWVWTMDVLGIVKLRFGLEVAGQYLVIRNIPWSNQDRVTSVMESPLDSAQLAMSPAACHLQLPGLFASAADQERTAAIRGLGRLHPLILCGVADVPSASAQHKRLFGFSPIHPQGGKWVLKNNDLGSSVYGTVRQQRQPIFDRNRPFGIMQSVDTVNLSMQFEEDGLRSRVIWKLRRTELVGK